MKRLVVLGTTLCVLWMAGPAQAKRDGGDDDEKGRQSCLVVVQQAEGDVELGCSQQ